MVKPVLPRSQCWCIDGNSIFALRVRADTYYRIELPYETEEDKKFAEELKSVFVSILRYEKTACPFMRGFDVEFPESDEITPRSGRWKNTEKARRWTLNRIWKPEDEPDYIPVCDRVMSPLTKEAKGDFNSRRYQSLKGDDISEGSDYSNDETISSIANSLSRSRSVQQDWLACSPLLVRRTRSVTPPHIKRSPNSFDARRRPFLKTAAARPMSMYDVSSPLDSVISKEQSDTQDMSSMSSINQSNDIHKFVPKELGHENELSKNHNTTLSEMTEKFETLKVPKTSRTEDKSIEENEKQSPLEVLETKSSPSESPPLTPPPLSDSEESFSPTWTEEIITPPDTLRVRQAVTRPHIRDAQSVPSSPTTSVPETESKEEQGANRQVDSFTSNPLATNPGTESPPEATTVAAVAAISAFTTPVTPTPSTKSLPTTPSTPSITTTKAERATALPSFSSTSSPAKLTITTPPRAPTDLKSILSSPQGRSLGLIQKAYIILVSPPTHVFALMYEIATRLAASSSLVAKEEEGMQDNGRRQQNQQQQLQQQQRRRRRQRQRQRQRQQQEEGEFYASGSLPGTWIANEDEEDEGEGEDEDEEVKVMDVDDDYGVSLEEKSWRSKNRLSMKGGEGMEEEEEEEEEESAETEPELEQKGLKGQKGMAETQSTSAAPIARTSLSDVD